MSFFRNSGKALTIASLLALPLAGVTGCSSTQGQGEQVGGQVGQQAGQLAGAQTAKEVPYVGGMLGGLFGREAGKAVGAEADKQAAQNSKPAAANPGTPVSQ